MSSKLNIKDAINMCNYPINIKRDFVEFLETTYGSQKHKLYLFARNETAPKLFLLQLQIPAKFNNQSYDISLLVYFPLNFPQIEPEIFFEKIGKVKINPNCTFYIDEDTLKINYSLFFSWDKSMNSFKDLISELYNQFNIAFPVFNLSDKNPETDKCNEQSDCVLKKNLCREIELVKPSNEPKQKPGNFYQSNNNQNSNYNKNNNYNNIYNKDMNNNINNLNNGMNNLNLNNNNNNNMVNIYGKKMNNNDNNMNNNYNMHNNNMKNNNNIPNNYRNSNYNAYNRNMNLNTGMNNINPYNINNNYNRNNQNNKFGINQMSNIPPPFDENKAKLALINLLKNNLSQKINSAIQPISASYLKLEKIKENILRKMADFDKVESKENAIRQTINTLYKEMDFTITAPKGIEKPDLNNLESILIISNKDYYLRLAKEKAIEEYILVVKKSYEKQNIDFNTALNLIRTNSRNIFFLKYKNLNPFGY